MKSRKEKQDGRGDEDGDKGRYHREIWRETELHKGRGRGEHLQNRETKKKIEERVRKERKNKK